MGLKNFFKRNKEEANNNVDPISDTTLKNMNKGWYVDYDTKTWEVVSASYYDWGAGDLSYEWQLTSYDDTIYLEREEDDEDIWSISRKVPLSQLGSNIKTHILEHEDPPNQIDFKGKTYYLSESGGGHFYQDKKSAQKNILNWDFEDESGENFLSIEQWGEDDFEASIGHVVFEYQFTNIIPGKA